MFYNIGSCSVIRRRIYLKENRGLVVCQSSSSSGSRRQTPLSRLMWFVICLEELKAKLGCGRVVIVQCHPASVLVNVCGSGILMWNRKWMNINWFKGDLQSRGTQQLVAERQLDNTRVNWAVAERRKRNQERFLINERLYYSVNAHWDFRGISVVAEIVSWLICVFL